MNELLLRLRDKGNTVLVIEHKPDASTWRHSSAAVRRLSQLARGNPLLEVAPPPFTVEGDDVARADRDEDGDRRGARRQRRSASKVRP